MDWPEIKRRLTKENTSVQILADLEGVPYKTMYQRIKWHERQDGKKYIQPHQEHPEPKTKKKEKLPEVVPVIVTNDYSCKGCANCIQTSFNMFCERGHECGENCVCSEYKAFPKLAQVEKPEILTKKLHIPEEKPEIPEEVKDADILTIKGMRVELSRDIPEDVYTNERKLMPETIEEILTMYKQCCELAERYKKQADDWARIMKLLQLEESERIRRT